MRIIFSFFFILITAELAFGATAPSCENGCPETYSIYSETYKGVTINEDGVELYTYKYKSSTLWGNSNSNVKFKSDSDTYFEGSNSFRTEVASNYTGVWMVYFTGDSKDLSDYSDGYVEYVIKMTEYDTGVKVSITIEDNEGEGVWFSHDEFSANGQWYAARVSLYKFKKNLKKIRAPVKFSITGKGTVWIDNVVWRKNKNAETGGMTLSLINRATGVNSNSITWNNIDPGSGWQLADQYIKLEVDYYRSLYESNLDPFWGIQIYTDNGSPSANSNTPYIENPSYDGADNPAGLIDLTYYKAKGEFLPPLPMTWRILDKTTDLQGTVTQIKSKEAGCGTTENWDWVVPVSTSTGQPICWAPYRWMQDRSTSGFEDGETDNIVWNFVNGIRWGDYDESGKEQFSGAKSPNYLVLAADFTHAIGNHNYSAKLTVELFYE
jgi:hypothetical protein